MSSLIKKLHQSFRYSQTHAVFHPDWAKLNNLRCQIKTTAHIAQSGQALLLGLLLLSASYLAAFGFIRLARLIDEKTRLINATDAAAYSTGIMHARLLNYNAYINRALIANDIAIAQWLSVGSWSQHIQQYQHRQTSTTQLQQTGLQSYISYYNNIPSLKIEADALLQQAKHAAIEHDIAKTALIASRRQAHLDLITQRRQLQHNIVSANLNSRDNDIYGWHRGDFRGLDESDTPTKTETPFTEENKQESITLLTKLAARDPFVQKRNWHLTQTPPICNTEPNQIIRIGGTQLINGYWSAHDKLTWQYNTPQHCQQQNILLSDSELQSHPWKLKASATLRTLSKKAQQLEQPRYLYRFRIRHRFTHIPSQLSQSINPSSHDPDDLPNLKPGLSQDFRTTVEVYFQRPDSQQIEKGDLFHPYWRVRFVKLKDEKGQALIESLFILSISAILLIGIGKIGHHLQLAHQTLVNSRNLAYQAAYQGGTNNLPLSPHLHIQSATFNSDTFPKDDITQTLDFKNREPLIFTSQYPVKTNSPQTNNNQTLSIKRSTTLTIDAYTESNPNHLAIFTEKLLPKITPIKDLNNVIKKIEMHHIDAPLINQTVFWQAELSATPSTFQFEKNRARTQASDDKTIRSELTRTKEPVQRGRS